MRAMIIAALLLIAGQASARGVTCWILNNTGISCLPDSSLPQSGTTEREPGRASQASPVSEKGLSVTTPLLQDERLKL